MSKSKKSDFKLVESLKSDAKAVGVTSFKNFIKSFCLNSGFSSVCIYRIQQYFQVRSALKLAGFFSRLNVVVNGMEMVVGCNFGVPLIVRHPVGIVAGYKVSGGSNITMMQGVTLGQIRFVAKIDSEVGNPTIGDNVQIGANAIILGGVSIGSNSIIGAGTFLTKDLPENHIAFGNPASIQPLSSSIN